MGKNGSLVENIEKELVQFGDTSTTLIDGKLIINMNVQLALDVQRKLCGVLKFVRFGRKYSDGSADYLVEFEEHSGNITEMLRKYRAEHHYGNTKPDRVDS